VSNKQCCCTNNHEPVDGMIFTSPACEVHRPAWSALSDRSLGLLRIMDPESAVPVLVRKKRTKLPVGVLVQ
jgi:hypothetical protein